jgi:hypothetical protein
VAGSLIAIVVGNERSSLEMGLKQGKMGQIENERVRFRVLRAHAYSFLPMGESIPEVDERDNSSLQSFLEEWSL